MKNFFSLVFSSKQQEKLRKEEKRKGKISLKKFLRFFSLFVVAVIFVIDFQFCLKLKKFIGKKRKKLYRFFYYSLLFAHFLCFFSLWIELDKIVVEGFENGFWWNFIYLVSPSALWSGFLGGWGVVSVNFPYFNVKLDCECIWNSFNWKFPLKSSQRTKLSSLQSKKDFFKRFNPNKLIKPH